MDKFYPLKLALSVSCLFFLCSTTIQAEPNIEFCGTTQDTVSIQDDHSRYTVLVENEITKLVLTDLEPGAQYYLYLNPGESNPDCYFSFYNKNQKTAVTPGNTMLEFTAKKNIGHIYVRNENHQFGKTFFANLSISRKGENGAENLFNMMGIATDPSYTAQQLIEDVFIGGGCFEVSNVTVIGNAQGIGYFSNGLSSVNIDEGVILASGAIGNSAGPNNVTNITTNFFDLAGDPDLDILATANVFDAVGIQFDFTPVVNTVQFRYVFASDEYCDYVNTSFNDVFGFFISGPGIGGPYSNNGENIAVVPGTNQDVSINTINIQTNPAYYIDNVPIGQNQNAGGCVAEDLNNQGAAVTEIEYDGFTTVLTATANVQACETYRIRMVVGDVNDGIYDSAVLLEANSFDLGGDVSMDIDLPGLGSSGIAYEGCAGDGFIIFERPQDSNLNQPVDVYFTISPASTATSGVDFTNLPPFITIPAGQTQFLLPLQIFEDFIDEGTETLILELNNPCTCQDASVEIQISDTPPMTVMTPDLSFCDETSTTLFADVAGGIPGYTYQWSTGGNGPSVTVNATTGTQTHTVTVTDECGNQEISTSTITVAEEAYAVIEGFAEVCETNPNGVLTITFTGTGPWDLTYMIDGVPQAPIIGITENPYFLIASEPGVYTIGSLFVAGCPGIGDGSGIILPTIFNSFIVPTPISCPGEFDGSLDLLITGGSPEYSYVWSNDQYTEDLEFLESGMYTVTVTDMNGCTHVDSSEVISPVPIDAVITELQGVNCLDTLSGAADLNVDGGTPGYTYLWDNGSTLEDPNDLSAGLHTVTVTDTQGCTTEATVTISQDAVPPVAAAQPENILNCENLQIAIDGSASTGTGTLNYSWLNASGTEIGTEVTVDVTSPGAYTLVVTNQDNGCSDEITINVDQDIEAPTPDASSGTITCETSLVTLDAGTSTGVGTLNYSWLDTGGIEIATTQMVDVEEAGTYTLIIMDESNGCTAELDVEVGLDQETPEVQAEPSGMLTCTEEMIMIDGSASNGNGTIDYEWSDPDGASLGSNSEIEVNTPGIYTLVITDDSNGCTAETTIEVEQNIDEPTPEAIVDDVLDCAVTSVFLDASGSSSNGGLTYQWLSGGTEISTSSGVDVDAEGTYILIVTDEVSGCTAETDVIVEQDIEPPTPDATVSGILTCDQLSVTLDGSGSSGNGNLEYEWQDSGGDIISNDPDFTVENAGEFVLVITDDSNGCTAEAMLTVEEDIEPPIADAGDDGLLNCDESMANLDGSGSSQGANIIYEWLNDSNVSIGEEISVDVIDPGTYTLVVTNTENGCTASSEVVIENDENVPEIDAVVDGVLNCIETEVTLDASASTANGTLAYEWFDEGGTMITETVITTVNDPGTYTLIVTDTDNGCTAQMAIEVFENIETPNPDILDPALLTCNSTNIELDASTSSGLGNLSYEWQNSTQEIIGTSSIITVENAGTYSLIISDSENGCTASMEIDVDENVETPIPDASVNGILTCNTSMLVLDAALSSANGLITYQWLDESNTELGTAVTNEVSQPGVYTLIITDQNNGCTASTQIEVEQDINDPVSISTVDDILNCSISTVNLEGTASTGAHPLSYQWLDETGNPIATTENVEVESAGVYTLIVTDQENGCTNSSTLEVDSNFDTPQPAALADGLLTCENLSVLLDGSNSNSSGDISYQWFDFNNDEIGSEAVLEVSSTGIYTLLITDQQSTCTASLEIEVEEDILAPIADAGPGNTLTCDTETVLLNGDNSSSGTNIIYEWINNGGVTVSTAVDAEVSEAGTYNLIVINTENGCTASSSVEVVPDENLPSADAGVAELLTCDVISISLNGSNSSQGSNISYEWLDPTGELLDTELEIEVNAPGTYTLIVIDNDNGCSTTASVEVEQNINAPVANPGDSPTLTCDQTTVLLDGSASVSSMGMLVFEWFDPNGLSISNTASTEADMAGIYTLVVSAENGCTNSAEVEVLLDANVPVADPGNNGTLNCDVSVLTLGGNGTSTGANISYEWLNSNGELVGTETTLDVSVPDTYTLNVMNSLNNCETSAQAIVDQDIELPLADAGLDATLTCTTTEFLLGGTGTSSGTEYQYEWTNESGEVISTDIVQMISDPGTYTFTVFNTNNGCETSAEVNIDQNIQNPVSNAGQGGILTCDVSEITLDGSASTGTALSYQWLNEMSVPVSTEIEIAVSEAGTFTLVVTNTENGCTHSSEVEVTPDENIPMAVATNDGMLTCDVFEVLIDATNSSSVSGSIDFEWLDTNGDFLSNDASLMVNTPGVYTVIITDTENGCTTNALVEVPQDIIAPEALAGSDDTLNCTITELQLNGLAGNGTNFSFNWLDNNNVSISQLPNVSVSSAGIYTLVVTNMDNGCSASDQVEIVPDTDLPLAAAGPGATLTCAVSAVILDASGSEQGDHINYEWQNSNGQPLSDNLQIEISDPGTYTIIVTDTDNNCVSEDQVVVTQDIDEPSAAIDGIGPLELNCDINAVLLNGENSIPFNDLSFEWSTTNGNITSSVDNYEIEVDQIGTYTLIVTDETNGCTDVQIYNVGENVTPPNAFINIPPIINCYNPQAAINAVNTSGIGDFGFSWTAVNNSGIVDGASTLDLIVDEPGVYILNIENLENGCDISLETEVLADLENPNAAASSDEMLDCVTPSVGLNGTGSSTGAIYIYEWQGSGILTGATTLAPIVNQSGTYTLIVTNTQNGCSETATTEVLENPNVPSALALDVVPPPCPGDNASIEVIEVVGGEGPYLYSIDGGDNFYDITYFFGLDPGAYDVVVQDVIGCEYEESVDIPEATNVFTQILLGLEEIELGDTVQLAAIVNVPEASLSSIVWNPASTLSCNDCLEPYAFPGSTTTYTLTVANENGCEATDKITLRVRKDRGIYIPNAFTPFNGDGINDIFHIFSDQKSVKNINSFQIFDRWGELVFEDYDFLPDDPAHGWDGTLRGEPMNPAVFVYWAAVEFIDGEIVIFKGDVTLIR